jgi:hypothetical protein
MTAFHFGGTGCVDEPVLFLQFQVRDDICALLRVAYLKEHLGSRNQRARIGQPSVQGRFIPRQPGGHEGLGVRVISNAARAAADNAAMFGAQIIIIEGMARLACVIQRFTPNRIAGHAFDRCERATGNEDACRDNARCEAVGKSLSFHWIAPRVSW